MYDETGADMLVLARADGAWQIAWRQQLPGASTPVDDAAGGAGGGRAVRGFLP